MNSIQEISISQFQKIGAAQILNKSINNPILIKRRGKEEAVILSWEDYLKIMHSKKQESLYFGSFLEKLRKRKEPIIDPNYQYQRTIIGKNYD